MILVTGGTGGQLRNDISKIEIYNWCNDIFDYA